MNNADFINQLKDILTLDTLIILSAIAVLSYWLAKTSFGKNALIYAKIRRTSMPFYIPFIPLLIWFALISLAMTISRQLYPNAPEPTLAMLDNIALGSSAIVAIIAMIALARKFFARKLKGLGLAPKHFFKDFALAFLTLLAVWPLILTAFGLTVTIGQLIKGPEFTIEQHQELILIAKNAQLHVRIIIAVVTILIIPVFEEMLFRGYFQTLIRSYIKSPWPAIIITSIIFAVTHANLTHWAVIFTLSMALGYSYEKSASLYRPIFIHAMFNATSVITTMLQ